MKKYLVEEIENKLVYGRTAKKQQPLTLFWTGSGLELNVKASELWMQITTDYSKFEQWIGIYVNGALIARQMLAKGENNICIFRGMNTEQVKNVRVVKEVQPVSDDLLGKLQIESVMTDGEFLPVRKPKYKIEFIGDSITSGEGTYGAKEDEDWIPMFLSYTKSYVSKIAEKIDADCRIISQSGWGIHCGWDNNINHRIPPYYNQVCGLVQGSQNEALGGLEENDFASWRPDAVIINLGTNDTGAFTQPTWRDPVTNETYKMRQNPDGSFFKDDIDAIKEDAKKLLLNVHEKNGDAYILWVLGMINSELFPVIREVVSEFRTQTGYDRASALLLDAVTETTIGSRLHPGEACHEQAAEKIASFLQEIIGK